MRIHYVRTVSEAGRTTATVPFYYILALGVYTIAIYCLFTPLCFKRGNQFRAANFFLSGIIFTAFGFVIGWLATLIFNKWGTVAFLSYLAFLVLIALAIWMFFSYRQRP